MWLILLVIVVLALGCYVAWDNYRDRHSEDRLLRAEYLRWKAEGASDSEAAAAAADLITTMDYTKRYRGRIVHSLQSDSDAGTWTMHFQDGAFLVFTDLRSSGEPGPPNGRDLVPGLPAAVS